MDTSVGRRCGVERQRRSFCLLLFVDGTVGHETEGGVMVVRGKTDQLLNSSSKSESTAQCLLPAM